MKTTTTKNCTCHTCNRTFHYLGITRHRAMHHDKREDCEITFTHGDRYCYWYSQLGKRPNWQITRHVKVLLITLSLVLAGCSPGQHHGHIYIHDPNHVEAVFDVPMSMSVEKDGIKVEASSKKAGLLEDIIKLLLLRPR